MLSFLRVWTSRGFPARRCCVHSLSLRRGFFWERSFDASLSRGRLTLTSPLTWKGASCSRCRRQPEEVPSNNCILAFLYRRGGERGEYSVSWERIKTSSRGGFHWRDVSEKRMFIWRGMSELEQYNLLHLPQQKMNKSCEGLVHIGKTKRF